MVEQAKLEPAARLVIGAMSGTSADGVDVALVRLTGYGSGMQAELVRHHDRSYDPRFAARIRAVRQRGETTLRELAEIGRITSLIYAIAVNELLTATGTAPGQVACIAAHGQTLFHAPPLTIQWLDPSLLAARTGCRVVSDFRRADCAQGGQGAPLVPFADYLLFRDSRLPRMLVNIGGIANLTWLAPGGTLDDLVAFDTGPGNCLSDWLVQTRGGEPFDAAGRLAMQGRCIQPLADAVLGDAYFAAAPPKSTDGPAMVAILQREMVRLEMQQAPLSDLLATACEISARAIIDAGQSVGGGAGAGESVQWVLAGGGVKNQALRQAIERALGRAVLTTDALGIPSQAREAVCFALLGAATLDGVPSNVPAVTGAIRPVVLGSICQP